jgi:Protein of unknown function, DUF547
MKKEHFILAFVAIFMQINLVAASRWLQNLPECGFSFAEKVRIADCGMRQNWESETFPAQQNQNPNAEIRTFSAKLNPHSEIHAAWDKLLQKHVQQGKVNYKLFKSDKIALENYIKTLSANVPAANASKSAKMAFWLNAYNALTIKLILDNYPIKSIKDLDKGNPWEVSRYKLGGKNYSLNEIENNILRPMGDARIHFGLNCAAKSCPPIHGRAFIAATVETQLDQLTRAFIQKTQENQLKGNTIKISNIFNWYAADFGNVVEFLNKYAALPVYKNAKITYTTYDWNLNE